MINNTNQIYTSLNQQVQNFELLNLQEQAKPQEQVDPKVHLILEDEFTPQMKFILDEIDRNTITDIENTFIKFLLKQHKAIQTPASTDFVKIKAIQIKDKFPSLQKSVTHSFYQRKNEYVVISSKIFRKEERLSVKKGVYFAINSGKIHQSKSLLIIKKIFHSSQSVYLENQLTFMNAFSTKDEVAPKIYGKCLTQAERVETKEVFQTLIIFQEKFGQDMYMSWDVIHALPLNEKIDIARKTTELFFVLHAKGFTHGDAKIENIVIEKRPGPNNTLSWKVALIDTEHSNNWKEFVGERFGTHKITPPEMFFAQDFDHDLDPFKAEIWSLGLILYELFAPEDLDKILFSEALEEISNFEINELSQLDEEKISTIMKKFEQQEIKFSEEFLASHKAVSEILQLIRKMLDLNPQARPYITEVKTVLRQIFLKMTTHQY